MVNYILNGRKTAKGVVTKTNFYLKLLFFKEGREYSRNIERQMRDLAEDVLKSPAVEKVRVYFHPETLVCSADGYNSQGYLVKNRR